MRFFFGLLVGFDSELKGFDSEKAELTRQNQDIKLVKKHLKSGKTNEKTLR